MKPISLTIDGINSFYQKQTVDFDFNGLFCISGNTGSGKTTILDCIIIALYGNGKRSSTLSDYINVRRNSADIRLEFETTTEDGKQRFEVTRTLRRTGNNKATLKNLTTGEVIAEQTENVNKAIERLTMLRREDFTQVVILEQGKFSKFLSASKKERNETVGNLFKLNKYKELGSKFSKRKELAKRDYEYITGRISELADVTLALIKDKEKQLKAWRARLIQIDAEQKELNDNIQTLVDAKRKFDKCMQARANIQIETQREAELDLTLAKINSELLRITSELAAIDERKAECERIEASGKALIGLNEEKKKREKTLELHIAEWKRADGEAKSNKVEYDEAVEKARKLHSMLNSCVDDIFLIADLGEKAENFDVFDIRSRAEKLVLRIESARSSYDEAVKTCEEFERRVVFDQNTLLASLQRKKQYKDSYDLLKGEVDALRLQRENEKRVEAAQYLRKGLKEGDVCPVCGGTIVGCHEEVAATSTESMLEVKEKELMQAENRLSDIEKNHASFATKFDESTKALGEATRRKNSLGDELKAVTSKLLLPQKLDSLLGIAAKACELQNAYNAAQGAVVLAGQKVASASARADEIKKSGERERAELNRLIEKVGDLGAVNDLNANSAKLSELKAKATELQTQKAASESSRDELIAKLAASRAMLEMYKKDAIDVPEFDPNELESKSSQLERLIAERESLIAETVGSEKDISVMKQKHEQKSLFEKQREQKKKELDIFSELYQLFSGDKFVEYIAEEYILQFTLAASDVLNKITNGKYTLEYSDGSFYVNDFLSGGLLRKADTLSGGETFLASLSLAIAISREIARFKSYEFFFLDEGFGTLDAAFIDTVLEALNSLAADTLVGVVTHRAELTEQIFDKITVLPANGDNGSVIVRS